MDRVPVLVGQLQKGDAGEDPGVVDEAPEPAGVAELDTRLDDSAGRLRTGEAATPRCTRNDSRRRTAFAQPGREDQIVKRPTPPELPNHAPVAGTETAGSAEELAGCTTRDRSRRYKIYIL